MNRVFYQFSVNWYIKGLMAHVRAICYRKWIFSCDIYDEKKGRTFDDFPQGEVLARIINDTESFRELITSGTFGIVIDIVFIFTGLAAFLKINYRSGVFLGVIEFLTIILLMITGRYLKNVFLIVRNAHGQTSRVVANLIGGFGGAFYSGHHNYSIKKGKAAFEDFFQKQIRANFWDASYYSAAESLYPVILALLILILPYSKITSAAVIFVLIDLLQRSISPIKEIAGKLANLQRAASGVLRINQFMDRCEQKYHFLIENDHLELRNEERFIKKFEVSVTQFQYKDRDDFVMTNIDIFGEKGESIGIVGISGSGKSTLLKMMAGKIISDGLQIVLEDSEGYKSYFPGNSSSDILSYRMKVGLISQDSHVFSETLHFNITFEKKVNSKFLEFWNWLEIEIPYLKFGGMSYSDEISPQSLSLGQRQLIAALRSCYLKKSIVLLDEISSALDNELEYALRRVILKIQEQSLTIAVAHRIETIIHSNRIYVMVSGKILAKGSHKTLLSSSPEYKAYIDELR